MNPINVVTELRNKHNKGEKYSGISVKKGSIINMKEENVLQPSLVTRSALTLATEVVRMILKIDDVVMTARWFVEYCVLNIKIMFEKNIKFIYLEGLNAIYTNILALICFHFFVLHHCTLKSNFNVQCCNRKKDKILSARML